MIYTQMWVPVKILAVRTLRSQGTVEVLLTPVEVPAYLAKEPPSFWRRADTLHASKPDEVSAAIEAVKDVKRPVRTGRRKEMNDNGKQ